MLMTSVKLYGGVAVGNCEVSIGRVFAAIFDILLQKSEDILLLLDPDRE